MRENPDEMISYCPFCGRKHGGNYVLCTECGALMCDSCDSVERRKMNDGEPLCQDCELDMELPVFEVTAYDERGARKELQKLIEKGVIRDLGIK